MHDLAGPHVQRQHGQVQRRGAVGAGDRVARRRTVSAKALLERLDPRAGGQEVGAQRLGDRRDVVVLDGLAAVGQEGVSACAGLEQRLQRRRRRASRVLVSLA